MKSFIHAPHIFSFFLTSFFLLCMQSSPAEAQQYRTFSQEDLTEKKIRIRQQISSISVRNINSEPMDGISITFLTPLIFLRDSSGFSNVSVSGRSKILEATGPIQPGEVVRFVYTHFTNDKYSPLGGYLDKGNIRSLWFIKNGEPFAQYSFSESSEGYLLTAGNVRDHMYRRVLRPGIGLLMGTPEPGPLIGSVRYLKSDRRQFPHTKSPRCFSFIRSFRNPKVEKHDNHLLGELHALKLAIIGNDSAFIDPWHDVKNGPPDIPLFGDLVYRDTGKTDDPANGLTIRHIASLGDSALSYCSNYTTSFYTALDYSISRINAAFRGELVSGRVDGQPVLGTRDISEIEFLHLPAGTASEPIQAENLTYRPEALDAFLLDQNYPNPFNPLTTIGFQLPFESLVNLKIYSTLGEEIVTLIGNEVLEKGQHEVEFDGQDFPSGVYFYRLSVDDVEGLRNGSTTKTGSMILIK